jgi:hypothetical protein
MGMSQYVKAYISDTDSTYQKQAKVLRACLEAEISLPEETAKYFGSKEPEEYLLYEKLEIEIPKTYFSEDGIEGFEISVKDLPVGVHKIRFINSW